MGTMRESMNFRQATAIRALGLGLVLAASPLPAQDVKDQKATPVEVMNSSPISVTGDISATLSESVAVSDIPDEVTDRLDMILDRLEDLANLESDEPPVADYLRYRSAATPEGDRLTFLFNRQIAISSILISSDDDKLVTSLCNEPTPDECFRGLSSATGIVFGSSDFVGPTESAVNFPLPVPAQSLKVSCVEAGDGGVCQYRISIVGRVIE